MAGPGDETTAPATTPGRDEGFVMPRVHPRMTDEQIRAGLRTAFEANADLIALVFSADPEVQVKDLPHFQAYLREIFSTADDRFRPRLQRLTDEVVAELAPKLFGYSQQGLANVHKSMSPARPAGAVAQAADPIRLFSGDFRYTTVDFQLNGAGLDLLFARTYSQLAVYTGPLGAGWDHSYNLWIRVADDANVLYRSTGGLAEEAFTRHVVFGYWVPPPGVHAVVVEDAESLRFVRADGTGIRYDRRDGLPDTVFVATRIADRYGNALDLDYRDGLLTSVTVNHPGRRVTFAYDDQRRIVVIEDFTGRQWRYDYDSEADLVAVTVPRTGDRPRDAVTRYEYLSLAMSPPALAHHLTTIVDADGRAFLENEYGTDPSLLDYRRVVAQRQGSGETRFEYADVVEDYDVPYPEHERPHCQTVMTSRDGRPNRYLFNRQGNMLLEETVGRADGRPARLTTHYRYNADGSLTGVASPLGRVTQALWGRDAYERRFPPVTGSGPEHDPDLTAQARLTFGNLLTVVKRGAFTDITRRGSVTGLWSGGVFPDILGTSDEDVIQRFTYEPAAGQVLTSSDPRVTRSAAPDDPGDVEYRRRLTRYTYRDDPAPGTLSVIELPTPTLPDGSAAEPVRFRFGGYDARGRVGETVAPNGLRSTSTYAPESAGVRAGFLVARTADPDGFGLREGLDLDDLGRVVRVSRPSATADGRFVSEARWDERSRLIETISTPPLSVRTVNAYDRAGHLVRSEREITDAVGARTGTLVTVNRYDDEARTTRQRIGDGRDGGPSKTRRVRYDGAGRPALFISPTGQVRRIRYDERSLVSAVIDDLGGVHAVTRRVHDADGRLSRLVDPLGGVTRFRRDALGRDVMVDDPHGNRLVRHFDKLGNPVAECFFERRDADVYVLVHRREFEYDELGRMVMASANRFAEQEPIDGDQTATAFRESGPGRLLRLQFVRDVLGNIVRQIDQDGRVFEARYDTLGRIVARIDPLGNEIRVRYDREGNVVRTDRREVTTGPAAGEQWFAESFAFDELNRMAEHRTPAGTSRFEHDSRGLPTSITDRLGHHTEHDYDVFGRRTATHRALGTGLVTTRYAYNGDDQLTSQTDHLGRITRFEYDTAGRLRRTELPDGAADEYEYDRAGQVVAYRDRAGLRRDLVWDPLGQLTRLTVPAGHGATDTKYAYDALGRLTVAANDFATVDVDYDSLAARSETTSFTPGSGVDPARSFVLARETSDTGAVTALIYPSGRRLELERDVLDRLTEVRQTGRGAQFPGDPGAPDAAVLVTIAYEGLRPARVERPGGVSTTYRYDFAGRAIEVEHRAGTGPPLWQQALYDAESRVVQHTEAAALRRYNRDELSRLIAVRAGPTGARFDLTGLAPPRVPVADPIPDRQAEVDALLGDPAVTVSGYRYDEVGNRLSATMSDGPHTYQPNALDEYATVDGGAQEYDLDGNRTGDGVFRYHYDFRSQLAAIEADGTGTVLRRDAFGRLVVEQSGERVTALIYDGSAVIEEHTADGLRRSAVHAESAGPALEVDAGGSEGVLLHDLTGSVRAVVASAVVRSTYRYDEFGRLLSPVAAGDENVRFFHGMRFSGLSGAYECGLRGYDPATGRFLQRDPRGFVDGTNLYEYARNDPLTRGDPDGAESRRENPPITARLGAELAHRHPSGFTLAVPDNFDPAKVRTYRERIIDPLDRGVGIRSRPAGMRTATQDIRARTTGLRDAFEASLEGGGRPRGTQIDHTVELQHIIRAQPGQFAPGADQVRPQDHRVQENSLNASQGSRARRVKEAQIKSGAPLDTPAGGVARERDLNKLWNRVGYRTAMRLFGHYNLAGGTFASLTSVGDAIREGDFAGAALGASGYLGGAMEIGGVVARSATLLRWARVLGAPGAVAGSMVVGVRIGTNLWENYVDQEAALDAGSWVEEATGSRVLGGLVAADTAIYDAIAHLPEAGYDYVVDNVTLDPEEIDWDRTLRPWQWF